jgi:glucose-6-phosphate-specific signal transduction histidine kinase
VTDYPLTIRHQDGRFTDVLYNASVYRDTRGKILGVFAAARDISLSKSDSTLALTSQDNGQGFDRGKVQKGVGLESMRERVEISGGEFQIESGIGQGTTIRAIWNCS